MEGGMPGATDGDKDGRETEARWCCAAATTDPGAARTIGRALGGTLYLDERAVWQHLPFRGLLTVPVDDPGELAGVGDVGVYRLQVRVMKPGTGRVFGLFPMVRAPGLSHAQSDAHWRDVHGPLALAQHAHMTEYRQLNVLTTVSGRAFDGFALCGFASEEDLRNRFYSEPDGPEIIARDVRRFADPKRSARRLVARVERFST